MESHEKNVDNNNNADKSSASVKFQNLDDHALDAKIQRTQNLLLHGELLRKSADGRTKLEAFLHRLLREEQRRKQPVQVQKAEPGTLSSVQELEIIAREDFSGFPDNYDLKLQHSSPSSRNNLPRNDNHSFTTYSKRAYDYSLGEEDSSQRKNKISKCSTSAYVLREENACRKSDEKKRESLSLTKEEWTKKENIDHRGKAPAQSIDHDASSGASTRQSDNRGKAPAVDESIHREVQSLLYDDDIAYSANPLDTIRKIQKKCNEKILQLLFIVPQTNEIRERVKIWTERARNCQYFLRPHDAASHDQGIVDAALGVGVVTSVDPNLPAHTSHHPTPSSMPILSTEMSQHIACRDR